MRSCGIWGSRSSDVLKRRRAAALQDAGACHSALNAVYAINEIYAFYAINAFYEIYALYEFNEIYAINASGESSGVRSSKPED
jgi:hypothetical protein